MKYFPSPDGKYTAQGQMAFHCPFAQQLMPSCGCKNQMHVKD